MSYKNISTKSFYSTATKKEYFHNLHKKRKKKRRERELQYVQRPLANFKQYHTCFSEILVWQWFPRQQEALDFCTKDKCLCVFAQEKLDGKRRYLVTTRQQFWKKYKEIKPSSRHFYEVVRFDDPCRLYFDIEFQHEYNNYDAVSASELIEIFICYACYCIYKEYGIVCQRESVVDLCSSTPTKFSRHLIFHIGENFVFLNNMHCGEFVKDVCKCLKGYLDTGKSNKFLPPVFENDSTVAFVGNADNTVLQDKDDVLNTNSELFPAKATVDAGTGGCLPPPTKAMPNTTSEPTSTTSTTTKRIPFSIRQHWIENLTPKKLNTLIVNTKSGKTFLCDLAVYTKNRNFRLYLSSKVSKCVSLQISDENEYCFKTTISRREKYFNYQMRNVNFDAEFEVFLDTLICSGTRSKELNILTYGELHEGIIKHQANVLTTNYLNTSDNLKTGTRTSTFPELDKFVTGVANRFGPKGHIRRWLFFESRQMVIYDIGDNRWCGNIQREHKSNHIYYVVDFKFNVVYQKCHDPDCVNYRSKEIAIPNGINPFLNQLLEDTIEEFQVSYDEELNQLLEVDFSWDDDDIACHLKTSQSGNVTSDQQEIKEKASLTTDEPIIQPISSLSPTTTTITTISPVLSSITHDDDHEENEENILAGWGNGLDDWETEEGNCSLNNSIDLFEETRDGSQENIEISPCIVTVNTAPPLSNILTKPGTTISAAPEATSSTTYKEFVVGNMRSYDDAGHLLVDIMDSDLDDDDFLEL